MEMLTFAELQNNTEWKEAVIVFTEGSFTEPYTKEERSYKISSDNKYFMANMNGNSLFGNCLDGKDDGVRLDLYMSNGWDIDHCYIVE